MKLNVAKRNLVRRISQVVGGQRYVDVLCLHGEVSIFRTFDVLGQPYRARFGSWFCECRRTTRYGDIQDVFSFSDVNIVPNRYNVHSVWRYSAETMTYLRELEAAGRAGYDEYIAIMGHFGMDDISRQPSDFCEHGDDFLLGEVC